MFVGQPEPAQVGRDDVSGVCQKRNQFAVVGAITGPTMQKDHGSPGTDAIISEPKAFGRQ